MEKLINIQDNKDLGQAVSARELYNFLGYSNTKWKRWYEKNIINNDFAIEGSDYGVFDLMSKTKSGRPTMDFALSIDFAKRIAMMSRTEKGEEARLYFLEMEKIAKNPFENMTKLEIFRLGIESEERRLLLEKQIEIQAPKVRYVDTVLASNTAYATTLIAKELGMSARGLNKFLYEKKIQHKVNGTWVLYSKYQDKNFTKTNTYTYIDSHGEQRTSMQTTWTEKGRFFIHELFNSHSVDQLVVNS